MSTSWMVVSNIDTPIVAGRNSLPSLCAMSSTLLTKRRAVDHCRVRSSLCRMH